VLLLLLLLQLLLLLLLLPPTISMAVVSPLWHEHDFWRRMRVAWQFVAIAAAAAVVAVTLIYCSVAAR